MAVNTIEEAAVTPGGEHEVWRRFGYVIGKSQFSTVDSGAVEAARRWSRGEATAEDIALVREASSDYDMDADEAAMALEAVLDVAADELEKVRVAAPDGGEGNGPDMLWLWYPRGGAVALGVWANEEEEEGDREWRRDIEGWVLPDSPPQVEIVFRVPLCEPALRKRLERYAKNGDGYFEPLLRRALQRETGK